MKKYLLLFICIPFLSFAQEKSLLVESNSTGLYVNHQVAAKENYYSIGRIYNISPRDIAPFNNLQLESGLNPGQQLKIPLNSTNFFQSGQAEQDETFVPVYYKIKNKEGLYRVAVKHNNLPLENLKQWNNIKGDAVKNGTILIIGFLKVKKELSLLAKNGIGTSIQAADLAKVEIKKSEASAPDKTNNTKEPVAIVKNTDSENKKVQEKSKAAETAKTQPSTNGENMVGVFKNQFDLQIRNNEMVENEGKAGIFKSTSGWADQKYYCLYNGASQGSIIKITNPANGKFVFAKVLDLIPDIKKNEGLLVCMSSAAAGALGVSETNFNCLIAYAK